MNNKYYLFLFPSTSKIKHTYYIYNNRINIRGIFIFSPNNNRNTGFFHPKDDIYLRIQMKNMSRKGQKKQRIIAIYAPQTTTDIPYIVY